MCIRDRVKFARTVRHHMQDPALYCNPGTHVWSPASCTIANALLATLRAHPQPTDDAVCQVATDVADSTEEDCRAVWARMQTYPYVFELAAIRGNIGSLALDGSQTTMHAPKDETRELSLACSTSTRWRVPLQDFAAFANEDRLTPALFELFAINFRQHAPPVLSIGKWHQTRKHQFPIPMTSTNGPHLACFPFFSRFFYLCFSYFTRRYCLRNIIFICSRNIKIISPTVNYW